MSSKNLLKLCSFLILASIVFTLNPAVFASSHDPGMGMMKGHGGNFESDFKDDFRGPGPGMMKGPEGDFEDDFRGPGPDMMKGPAGDFGVFDPETGRVEGPGSSGNGFGKDFRGDFRGPGPNMMKGPKGNFDFDFDENFRKEDLCENFNCEFDIKSEIADMIAEIKKSEIFIVSLLELEIEDQSVIESINKLKELVVQAGSTLEKMQAAASSADFNLGNIDEYWELMDEIELAARVHMDRIFEYMKTHSDTISTLRESIPEEMETMMEWYMDEGKDGPGPDMMNGPDRRMGPGGPENSMMGDKDFGMGPGDRENPMMNGENPGRSDRYRESFMSHYGDIGENPEDFYEQITRRVEGDVIKKVMRAVNGNLMKELSRHFDDEKAGEMLGNIMNGMNVFGEEFGSRMLENQAQTLDMFADFQPDQVPYSKGMIMELSGRAKNTVIPEKYREKLAKIWSKIEEAVKLDAVTDSDKDSNDNPSSPDSSLPAGDTAVEDPLPQFFPVSSRTAADVAANNRLIDGLLIDLKTLLDIIDEENILGENPIEFRDVKFSEKPWYWEPVMSARNKGIINGYRDEKGSMTGNFGPSDNVTYAQALKMAMEAAGHHVEEAGSDSSANLWYEGYLDKLDELDLEKLNRESFNDWEAPASRGDVLRMINQVFEIKPAEYREGTFSDLDDTDDLAAEAMAAYNVGIFTGEGDTGKLNPEGRINRAGFAKVINNAMRHNEGDSLVERLEAF